MYRSVRSIIASDIAEIEKDPYGVRSIDPDRTNETAQKRRAVNRATPELEKALGVGPVCVKSDARDTYLGNKDRENLYLQLEVMRKLALQNPAMRQRMMELVGDAPLRFAQVYMSISYPITKDRSRINWTDLHDIRQFLFLEFIPDARRIEPVYLYRAKLTLSFGGGNNYSQPVEALNSADHPRLRELLRRRPYRYGYKDEEIEFADLQDAIHNEFGVRGITDIAARNLLWTPNAHGGKDYFIIDQRYPHNIT